MFWFGMIFVAVVLVAIAALFKAWDYYTDSEHFEWLCAQKSMALVVKERRITSLKNQLREAQDDQAAAEALVLDKDAELNELEKKLRDMEKSSKQAESWLTHYKKLYDESKDAKTPEWYKAEYLRLIQAAKNDQQMIKLLEQSNACLKADNEKALHDVATLSTRIRELREAYEKHQAEKKVDEPVLIFGDPGPFSQISGIQEVKDNDGEMAEPCESEAVRAGCEMPAAGERGVSQRQDDVATMECPY